MEKKEAFPLAFLPETFPLSITGIESVFSRAKLYFARKSQGKTPIFIFGSPASQEKFLSIVQNIISIQNRADFLEWEFYKNNGAACSLGDILSESSQEYIHQKYCSKISCGDSIHPKKLVEILLQYGYLFEAGCEEKKTFFIEGDTMKVRTRTGIVCTLSWFGNEIENIKIGGDDARLCLFASNEANELPSGKNSLYQKNSSVEVFLFDSEFETTTEDILLQEAIEVSFSRNAKFNTQETPFNCQSIVELRQITEEASWISVFSRRSNIKDQLKKHGIIAHEIQKVNRSGESVFFPEEKIFYLGDDILSKLLLRPRTPPSKRENTGLLLSVSPGDYVVHQDHGIGKFTQIVKKDISGITKEYFAIDYRSGDKLFVPLTELYRITKYLGEDSPQLAKLGGNEWRKAVEHSQGEIAEIAADIVAIAAKRQLEPGISFQAFPEKEIPFTKAFPHEHTSDQKAVIAEIYEDMEAKRPMDRFICGDVGFGKTEVAMHAMYRCILNKKQVAFISPLVVLALEHNETLQKRFSGFGVRMGLLTRLTSEQEAKRILQEVSSGEIDILVGTHRLLSEKIQYHKLGLLVLDEEHRFGVAHKEAIKRLQNNIDVLALSATPIPRSLHFALSGMKKMSLITTPPPKKKAIESKLLPYSEKVCILACQKEFERDGQVIVIESRVAQLEKQAAFFEKNIKIQDHKTGKERKPTILTLHGGMDGTNLDDKILAFKQGNYDMLIATTVIENGVNFLQANTLIVLQAEQYGLASLHQLRGRVGRKDVQAYCYFLYNPEKINPESKKRLTAIATNSHLGAGYEIAMQDLQIRGAGELLGIRQSGKTQDIGVALYLQMLEEAVVELRQGKQKIHLPCKIDLGIQTYIDDEFFESDADKMQFYRGLESVRSVKHLEELITSFDESLQNEHVGFANLCLLLRAKILFEEYWVSSISKNGSFYCIDFPPGTTLDKIKGILNLDYEHDATIVNATRVRFSQKTFKTDTHFLSEMTRRMQENLRNGKNQRQ